MKSNYSVGVPNRARQLLKYKTFVDWGKGKSNYEICNLSGLRTKALQGRSRNGGGNRLPEVRQNNVCTYRQDGNAGKRKPHNKTDSMQRCGVSGNAKEIYNQLKRTTE